MWRDPEHAKNYWREWKRRWYAVPKNKAKVNKRRREKRKANPEAFRKWKREYYRKNKKRLREEVRRLRAKLRKEVIQAYGGKCKCCGETEQHFLTIDHKKNDGAVQRRKTNDLGGALLYGRLRRQGFPKRNYQLLCFNCNCGRFQNGGTCPHKTNIKRGMEKGDKSCQS